MKNIYIHKSHLIGNETFHDWFIEMYVENDKLIKGFCNSLNVLKKDEKN